jgi:hypothetical protein
MCYTSPYKAFECNKIVSTTKIRTFRHFGIECGRKLNMSSIKLQKLCDFLFVCEVFNGVVSPVNVIWNLMEWKDKLWA